MNYLVMSLAWSVLGLVAGGVLGVEVRQLWQR